jgi:TolA-binding protein
VNATQRVEELLELRDELQAQLESANKSLKDQEAKLKAAREEGQQLQAQFAAADEAKAAAEKVGQVVFTCRAACFSMGHRRVLVAAECLSSCTGREKRNAGKALWMLLGMKYPPPPH